MIDNKKWLKFELKADIDKREHFEIWFCREFFKISQWLKSLDDVQIIQWLPGIENTPVNGVAFQSKYFSNWSWPQIKDSLEKVRDHREKLFPDLEKVYIYVKSINSKSYLENKNDKNGIIQELWQLWIEVIIYDGWEKIWEEDKYESLREYFVIPEDVSSRLKLVKKYSDNLYIDIAEEILWEIFEKIDTLSAQHKYEAYFYRGKIKELRSRFGDISKIDDKSCFQDFIQASKCKNDSKSKRLHAVWLLWLWNIQESEKIIETLLKQDPSDEIVYGYKLYCLEQNDADFDEIYNTVDPSFLDNQHILSVLDSIARKRVGIKDSFERFGSKINYQSFEHLSEKISYALAWSSYLDDTYGLLDIDTVGRESYIKLSEFIASFLTEVQGKNLFIEKEVLNSFAIIHSKVLHNSDEAEYYFQKILENFDSWII